MAMLLAEQNENNKPFQFPNSEVTELGWPGNATLTGFRRHCSCPAMADSAVSRFSSILEELAEGLYARLWVGPPPEGQPSMIAAIASHIGLDAHGREADFQALSADDATVWLLLYASASLHHGNPKIPAGALDDITDFFASLGPYAQFFSKGLWRQTRHGKHYELVRADSGWARSRHHVSFASQGEPLSPIKVPVDGGLIGIGAETAFAFWVEEDD